MVHQIRELQLAMGDGTKCPQPSEWNTRQAARQQVIAARAIAAGSVLVRDDLTTARSGSGVPAMSLWSLVGKTARYDVAEGDLLTL